MARFDDGDVLIDEIKRLAVKERISAGLIVMIGALRKGHIVTGPKKPKIPPDPNWETFKDAWEIAGLGTIFKGKKGPEIHIHGALGKGKKTLAGCIRKDSKVFLLIEAVIFELKGIKAEKKLDPKTGLKLLSFLSYL
ncbi:MAG: DNA-binding protein [Candidatus Omnitrophica bacterium]|nr:DNA-binding protein [Candidatus Omnitrophota bacterium]